MIADLHLAFAHHLLVFALAGLLFSEMMLVRPGLSADTLRRVGGLDRAYGIVSVLILAAGAARVVWGLKGWDYYAPNTWFWAKMAAFLVVGILSVPPSIAFVRWTKAAKADAAYRVPDGEIARIRRILHIELAIFFTIPLFAAAMARFQG